MTTPTLVVPQGGIIPVRTSERTCFKDCRQKWYWAYVSRLEAKRQRKALEFGTLIHAALAVRYKPGYKRGPHPAKTFVRLYDAAVRQGKLEPLIFKEDETGVRLDGRELGEAMLLGFVEEYGDDERFRVIQPELSFQIDIHDHRTGKYLYTYVSTTDVLVEDLEHGKLGYLEWKTSANLEPFGAPLSMDEQANSYWTFGTMYLHEMGLLKPDEDVDFMLYTFLKKAMPDKRPKNEYGHALNKPSKEALVENANAIGIVTKGATVAVLMEALRQSGVDPEQLGEPSKNQPGPLFRREWVMRGAAERQETFRRAKMEVREMQLVREGKLGVYKNPGRHCGYCEFRDMCEVHETGSDWKALRDTMFRKWDPYEDHHAGLALDIAKELIKN